MTDALTPANEHELVEALARGLRYEGRKRVHHADEIMAQVTAERLVRHLEQSGFVLMRKPPASAPTTSHMPTPHRP